MMNCARVIMIMEVRTRMGRGGGGIEKMRRGEDDRDREWDQGWEGTKSRGPWGRWDREEERTERRMRNSGRQDGNDKEDRDGET